SATGSPPIASSPSRRETTRSRAFAPPPPSCERTTSPRCSWSRTPGTTCARGGWRETSACRPMCPPPGSPQRRAEAHGCGATCARPWRTSPIGSSAADRPVGRECYGSPMTVRDQRVRERTEELERQLLSPRATLAASSKGREQPEDPDGLRTVFQQD